MRGHSRIDGARSGLIALLVAAAGCDGYDGPELVRLRTDPGVAVGEVAQATIGADGGTLRSADGGLELEVPAGALAADTELSVTAITLPASNAVSAYRLEPDGTTFATPVTLTWRAEDVGTGLWSLGVARREDAGTWRYELDEVKDEAADTVAIAVSHFSDYSLLRGYQLQPADSWVDPGEALPMQIVACAELEVLEQINGHPVPASTEKPPSPYAYQCAPVYFPDASATGWQVDGIPGGNRVHGTIDADGAFYSTYVAPDTTPDPDTVAVSVTFRYGGVDRKGKALEDLLVARVTVFGDRDYDGDFTIDAHGLPLPWTGTGLATWEWVGNEYFVSGQIQPDQTVFTMDGTTCTLEDPVQPFTFDAGTIRDDDPDHPTVYWGIPTMVWSARCCDDNGNCGTVPQLLSLVWASGCAGHWAEIEPTEYAEGRVVGAYTWPSEECMPIFPGMPTAEIEWWFTRMGDTSTY